VKTAVHHFYLVLLHLGGFGLIVLGVLDSSFLVMPLGNDLLVVAMTARRHVLMPYYASMAAVGSVLGCVALDLVSRAGGEKGLEKHVPRRRLEYVRNRMKKNGAWALIVAALMPPPFPFTPFVAAASALNYPRKKLLAVIGFSRLVRFSIEGLLAILFGERILRLARTRSFEYVIGGLIVVSIAASGFSLYNWIQRSGAAGREKQGRAGQGSRKV
jgi:membrane protein YqaA with SNARE-associated domain